MGELITLDGVTKDFGEGADALRVIEDFSFSVEEDEFLAIVGPSGCGKTTLLKIIDGLVPPTSGEVRIDGTPIHEPMTDIAMVFQTFQLFPWRSVRDNIALGLEIQGVEKERRYEVADDWIETVGLEGFEDSYPAELSGGMQQRVGLARALAVDPKILLMDEPFGSLDAQTKERLQTELLRLLERENKTVVFITHDISEAIYLADRVMVMSSKPATIIRDEPVGFDRPRWDRRIEIESSDRYDELLLDIRRDLGLTPEES